MPDGETGGDLPLEQMLGEVLLTTCPAETRAVIEAEVDLLMLQYMAGDDAESLITAAQILEKPWDFPPSSRTHLLVWAALLRRRAEAQSSGRFDSTGDAVSDHAVYGPSSTGEPGS